MINRTLFGIPAEIDEATTAEWYSKQKLWGCECGDCRNFLEQSRQNKLPEPVHAILNELKIAAD